MIRITLNTETKVATIGTTTIKTAADVPVEVVFTAAPGDVGYIHLALGTDSDSPAVLANTQDFSPENATTWRGVLNTGDARLEAFMVGKANATARIEVMVLLDGEQIRCPDLAATVQKHLIGQTADTSGPNVTSFLVATPGVNTTTFRLTFSEGVTGVNAADFTFVGGGGVTGSIASVTAVNTRTYDVVATHSGSTGTARARLRATEHGITDLAPTPNAFAPGAPVDSAVRDVTPPIFRFAGVSSSTSLDAAGVQALAYSDAVLGTALSFTATPSGQFIYIATQGTITSLVANGLPSLSDFILQGTVTVSGATIRVLRSRFAVTGTFAITTA
jgi:hypothetical protein